MGTEGSRPRRRCSTTGTPDRPARRRRSRLPTTTCGPTSLLPATCGPRAAAGRRPGQRAPPAAGQRRRPAAGGGLTEASGLYSNATGDEVVYLRTGTAAGVVVRRPRLPRRRLRGELYRHHHRWVLTGGDGEPVAALVIEARPRRPAGALPVRGRPVPRAQPVLRARPPRPREPPPRGRRSPATTAWRCSCASVRASPATATPTTRSTWSDGTGACIRTGCPSTTSSRSPAECTSRRRSTRPSPARASRSFVPRKLDYHPAAVPTPYNHANVDSDEVLFYCAGDFTSRGRRHRAGSISLHPGGFTHACSRAASSVARRRVDRRAGGHDRHSHPWRWPARRKRGPRLRLDLGGRRALIEAPLARSVSPDRWRRR